MSSLSVPLPDFNARYGVEVALYSADERFDFEIQVAADLAGAPNLGTANTLPPMPGGTRVFTDERPNDGLTRWYRIRHVREGYDASAWTCWVSGAPRLLLGSRQRPDAVAPVIAVAQSFDGTTGTISITPADPQCRITKVEAQTTSSAGSVSAWTVLTASSGVYSQSVAQGGPAGAKIAYRVTGYNEKGTITILEQDAVSFPASSASLLGPNLDVRAVGGPTSWSIYWSGSGVTLDINGAGYGTPPSSPIVVTRPAAGAQDLVYTFKGVLNGQTATDSVSVPSIDKDSVPADLVVTQGTMDGLTVPFTVSATRGDTGGAIAVQAMVVGCTATNNGTGFSEGSGYVTVTGPVVANRPAWGTTNGMIKFRTYPYGGTLVAEEATRTVLRQEKISFGPTLVVTPTPGPTSYSIAWSGDGVLLSVDGGTYGVPPSSPIVVTRNDVGGADKTYSFKGYLDQQTVVDSVTVPAKGAKDTPDLSVTQGAMTDTTIPFTVTFSAPGGSTANCIVYLVDCTADVSSSTFVYSGQVINVNRPAFGSKAGSIRLRAYVSGGGAEEISRTVVTQIKTSFGPTLDVSFAETSTQVTIYYNAPGASMIEYSIDGSSHVDLTYGGYSNNVVVSRNGPGGATKQVTIFATKDGQMVSNTVAVNPQPRLAPTLTLTVVDGVGSVSITADADGATLSYVVDAGSPVSATSGVAFVIYRNGPGGAVQHVTVTAQRDGTTVTNTVEVTPKTSTKFTSLLLSGCTYGANNYTYLTSYWNIEGPDVGSGYYITIDYFFLNFSGYYQYLGSDSVASSASGSNSVSFYLTYSVLYSKAIAKMSLVNSSTGYAIAGGDTPGSQIAAC